MKIVKTPFRTEIEFTPEELYELPRVSPFIYEGIADWVKKNFSLDMRVRRGIKIGEKEEL